MQGSVAGAGAGQRVSALFTIGDLAARLAERAGEAPPGAWARGFGYDNTKLTERRHPTRAELDRAAPDQPVVAQHTSAHMLVANSRALAAAGVGRESQDPPGGRIGRDAGSEPDGLLQENAQRLATDVIPPPTLADMREALRRASERMAREGITSYQDANACSISRAELAAWQAASDAGELRQRASLILGPFTRNAAFAAREEGRKGTLTASKLADFVVLAADPTAVPPGDIAAIPVVATFVGGSAVYEARDL